MKTFRHPVPLAAALLLAAGAAAALRASRTAYWRATFGDAGGRLQAVRELRDKPAGLADRFLLRALSDPSSPVRGEAVQELARRRTRAAAAPCRALLRGDADSRVRAAAAGALGEVGDAACAPALLDACADGSDLVRAAAAASLARLAPARAVARLIALLADPSDGVRQTAILELGRLRAPAAVPALIARLDAEQEVPLSRVQDALTAITGRNLGLDARAWHDAYGTEESGRRP